MGDCGPTHVYVVLIACEHENFPWVADCQKGHSHSQDVEHFGTVVHVGQRQQDGSFLQRDLEVCGLCPWAESDDYVQKTGEQIEVCGGSVDIEFFFDNRSLSETLGQVSLVVIG